MLAQTIRRNWISLEAEINCWDQPKVSDKTVEVLDNLESKVHVSQSLKLGIPKTTINKVLHKRLKLQAYNLQVLQELKPDDFEERLNFAVKILNKIDVNQSFLDDVIFTDGYLQYERAC